MKKNELLHVHGLLSEVAGFCSEGGNLDIDLEAYHETETRPTSISHAKAEHEDAVFALAEAITAAIRDDTRADVDVNPGGKEDGDKTASSSAL
jgi:hypothetical protein